VQDYESLLKFLENKSNVRDLNLPAAPRRWSLWSLFKNPNTLYEEDVPHLIEELRTAIKREGTISATSSEKLRSINTTLSEQSRISISSKMKRDTEQAIAKTASRERWNSLTPLERDTEFMRKQRQDEEWEEGTRRINAANRKEMEAHDATRRCPEHPQYHPSQCKGWSHSVASYKKNNPGSGGKRSNKSRSNKSRSKKMQTRRH